MSGLPSKCTAANASAPPGNTLDWLSVLYSVKTNTSPGIVSCLQIVHLYVSFWSWLQQICVQASTSLFFFFLQLRLGLWGSFPLELLSLFKEPSCFQKPPKVSLLDCTSLDVSPLPLPIQGQPFLWLSSQSPWLLSMAAFTGLCIIDTWAQLSPASRLWPHWALGLGTQEKLPQ